MKTFNEGDRVTHPTLGEGTIVNPYPGTGWPTVQFHGAGPIMVADSLLTPVVEFKVGDRVSHPLHRDGVISEISEHSGLIEVFLGGNRAYRALPHQIKHAKPEPSFAVAINYTLGLGEEQRPFTKKGIEQHLAQIDNWDIIDSINIKRIN